MKIEQKRSPCILGGVFLAAVVLSSCGKLEQKKEYLARVGDAYLTKEQVAVEGDSGTTSSKARLREYVGQWINNELLYQEAKRRGVETSESFQKLLTDARKRLSVEVMLEKEVYHDSVEISEDSIRAYFESHPNDFLLTDDVIQLSIAAFTTRELANSFRTKVTSGVPWESALESMMNDSASQKSILMNAGEKYYSQHTLYPAELWRVANNLAPKELSFPIRTQTGYFILRLSSLHQRGSRADIAMVYDEIRQRLTIERRRARYNEILSNLRSKHEVEITIP